MNRLLRLRHRTRNLLGVLFVFAFFANAYEALIPDVHDGDAVTAAASGHASASDAEAASSRQHRPARSSMPDLPRHAQHVDHCTHSHVASVTADQSALDDAPVMVSSTPSELESPLRGIAHAPGLRPPIA